MDYEARQNRREAQRRAARRRRTVAVLLVTLAAVVTAIAVNLSSGTSNPTGRPSRASGVSRTSSSAAREATSASSASAGGGSAAATGRPGTESVPILMYHVIAAPPAGAPYPGLYVTPAELAAQVQTLKSAGWHAVTLDQVEAYWRSGVPLGPGKPIVLSFDNGYHSQYSEALPILRQAGWVGDENVQLTGLPPSQGGLSQEEIRGLIAAGWELDTQGISHADLIALDAEQLHYQVAVARTTLQRRYHVPVNWFCYPSGHYNATVIAVVRGAGFKGSTTVVPGWAHPADDPYRLHRLRVLGGTTPQGLLTLIAAIRQDPPAPASYG